MRIASHIIIITSQALRPTFKPSTSSVSPRIETESLSREDVLERSSNNMVRFRSEQLNIPSESAGLPAELLESEAEYKRVCGLVGCVETTPLDGSWDVVYAAAPSHAWLGAASPSARMAPTIEVTADNRIAISHNGVALHASLAFPGDPTLSGTFRAVPEGTIRGTFDAVELDGKTYSGAELDSKSTLDLLDAHDATHLVASPLQIAPFHLEPGTAAAQLLGDAAPRDHMAARLTVGGTDALVLLRRTLALPALPIEGGAVEDVTKMIVVPAETPRTVTPPKRPPVLGAGEWGPAKLLAALGIWKEERQAMMRRPRKSLTEPAVDTQGYYMRDGDGRRRKTVMGAAMGGYDSPSQLLEEEGLPVLLFLTAVTAPHATAYWHRLWMWQTLVAAGLLTHVSHGGAVHFLA